MASTTAFGSLPVPAPEDTMEMSSPANRNLDDDIDIDFDDYQGGVQLTDDETMLEDSEQTRPGTATDEMMDDDAPQDDQTHEEEMMEEAPQPVEEDLQEQDEELLDYGDDYIGDELVESSTIQNPTTEPTNLVDVAEPAIERFDTQTLHGRQELSQEHLQSTANVVEQGSGETQEFAQPAESALAHADSAEAGEQDATDETVNPPAMQQTTGKPSELAATDSEEQAAATDHTSAEAPITIDTAAFGELDEGPPTPTDTGLHPTTIRYGDMVMPLFKSKRQPDGLLKDDNLASVSLAELIQSCRQRLALQIGESVSEDQELVLGFDHLGLMLVEDSRPAFENSLNDVLEVYLQLHRNDNTEDIPPLSLTISLQLKFTSSFLTLKQAAAGGQGMSSFAFLSRAEPVEDDYFNEPYDDGIKAGTADAEHEYVGQEDDEAHNYDETTFVETSEEHFEEQYDDQEVNEEDSGEYQEEQYLQEQEEHQDAYAEVALLEDEPAASAIQRDDHQSTSGIHSQSKDAIPDDSVHPEPNTPEEMAAPGHQDSGSVETASGKDAKGPSPASSATLQGDTTNSTVGEYNDDFIDWDDDGDLTSSSSVAKGELQEDYSTLLTEYDDIAEQNDAELQKQEQLPADDPITSSELHNADTADGESQDALADRAVSYDDIFNDLDNEAEVPGEKEEFTDGYEAGDDPEETENNQADTFGEQQDEYHPDYQPGEEDEQFHTAHDILDGENDVYGLENDLTGDHQGTDENADIAGPNEDADQLDGDDHVDFGEDDANDEDSTKHNENGDPSLLDHPTAGSGLPLGKRSFQEHAEADDFEDDNEPGLKKARPS